jgi:hypothetical protein
VVDSARSERHATTWSHARGNSVRIQIDAACTITDESDGGRETFYLIAPCRKEWMYRETGLVMEPGAEYRAIFGRDRQLDVAMSTRLHGDRPLPGSTAGFTTLAFEIGTIAATLLESDADIVEASAGNAPIVARTSIADTERGLTALLEYPIRTMNSHPERGRFQVDTGPLIFADLSRETAHPIEHCRLAHTVYNTLDYAEFTCRSPESHATNAPGAVAHFHIFRNPLRPGITHPLRSRDHVAGIGPVGQLLCSHDQPARMRPVGRLMVGVRGTSNA